MKKVFLFIFITITLSYADIVYTDPSTLNNVFILFIDNSYYIATKNNNTNIINKQQAKTYKELTSNDVNELLSFINEFGGKTTISLKGNPLANKYIPTFENNGKLFTLEQFYTNALSNDRELLNILINDNDVNFSSFYGFSDNCENILYDSNGYAVGFYSENGDCLKPDNEDVFYSNNKKAFFTTETDENGNLIYKIINSKESKILIYSFADQLKKLAENTEIRLFAAVMVIVGGFVAFRLVKRGLNWLKMEPYYSDLDKAYEAYKKGEVGDFTLNKALGRDYKRYKMKNSQWHYGKNGKVVFDNTDGVMSFREFSKNRLKDRWKYKNQYDAKKNEGFKKYVDKKQKIEDLEFKRLPDEQLSSEDYRKKYEKEINGFLVHHMNNYRSYDETFLRKEYMEKGIYNEETETEIQNMLNIIEEENRKSDQEFFDKQEEIYSESPIDSMEWHYPISEA